MKIFQFFLALLFLAFAVVQYNDPDPLAWMFMYSFVAGVCGFAAFERWNKWVLLLGLAVVMIWAALLAPDFIRWIRLGMPNIAGSMKAETPYIELMREFSGLLLCFLVLGFQYIKGRKKAFGQAV